MVNGARLVQLRSKCLFALLSLALTHATICSAKAPADPTRKLPGLVQTPTVTLAVVDVPITNATRDYLKDAIAHAETSAAAALLIELDTPGGLLEATRDIVAAILRSRVPVIVYIAPNGARAASAGLFIAQAAHVAAMAPTTHIGAAHPVGLFGGDVKGEMARKVVNDTVAWARSLAHTRGRNTEWVEKAVRESASLPAQDALAKKVVDVVEPTRPALLATINGQVVPLPQGDIVLKTSGAKIEKFDMSGRQALANFLADPNLMYLMLLLGLFLLFLEFKNPGLIVPGVVGAILVGTVVGIQVLPVNWLGVILIIGSAALFIAEIYVTSFGLLSIAGLTCLVVGSYLLFDVTGSTLRVDPAVIWSISITFAALLMFVGTLLLRAKRQGAISGVDAMAGEVGIVYEDVTPGQPGRILLRGAYWKAVSEVAIKSGAQGRVIRMDGSCALIAPVSLTETSRSDTTNQEQTQNGGVA